LVLVTLIVAACGETPSDVYVHGTDVALKVKTPTPVAPVLVTGVVPVGVVPVAVVPGIVAAPVDPK
jgi:hypothetical protein